jgi:subtilisin family serine protease
MLDESDIKRYFVPSELLIKFKKDATHAEIDYFIKKFGFVTDEEIASKYYQLLANKNIFEFLEKFNGHDLVEFCEPSEYRVNHKPCKGYCSKTGNKRMMYGDQISLSSAKTISSGIKSVVVAVIDSGFNLKHENIYSNLVESNDFDKEWNFSSLSFSNYKDHNAHGTKVAIIAAGAHRALFTGIANNSSILPIKIDTGYRKFCDIVSSIYFIAKLATDNKGKRYIINCSWGFDIDNIGLRNAIQFAIECNVLVICGAGNCKSNNDENIIYPAAYPNVVNVTAVDNTDRKLCSANYGCSVTLSAPGENILIPIDNKKYKRFGETSAAAPHVAGLAALIWSVNMNLSNEQVRNILIETCDDIDKQNESKYSKKLGSGRINAYRALNKTIKEL